MATSRSHISISTAQLYFSLPDWSKLCKVDGEWCAPNAGDWVSSAVWRTLQLRKQVRQIVPYKRNRCIMCCLWAIMRKGKGIVKCMLFHTMSYLNKQFLKSRSAQNKSFGFLLAFFLSLNKKLFHRLIAHCSVNQIQSLCQTQLAVGQTGGWPSFVLFGTMVRKVGVNTGPLRPSHSYLPHADLCPMNSDPVRIVCLKIIKPAPADCSVMHIVCRALSLNTLALILSI